MYSHGMTLALIAGGGLAGPVTAMALRQAGVDACVYEAYDRGADGVGAFGNGLRRSSAVSTPVRP